MESTAFPDPPPDFAAKDDFQLALYKAKLDECGAILAEQRGSESALSEHSFALDRIATESRFRQIEKQTAFDLESAAKLHAGLVEIAKTAYERSRAAGQMVQVASSAVATVYTGVLALVFSAKDRPMPLIGILPSIFLAISIVAATIYVSYLLPHAGKEIPLAPSPPVRASLERAQILESVYVRLARSRSYVLHVANVALGFAVINLPVAFISPTASWGALIPIAGIGITVSLTAPMFVEKIINKRRLPRPPGQGIGNQANKPQHRMGAESSRSGAGEKTRALPEPASASPGPLPSDVDPKPGATDSQAGGHNYGEQSALYPTAKPISPTPD
jgi:hypothetical protein